MDTDAEEDLTNSRPIPLFVTQQISTFSESVPEQATIYRIIADRMETSYMNTGSLKDLDRAIEMHEQALALMPNDDDPSLSVFFDGLGLALHTRFDRMGSTEDLNRAITMNERAV